MKGFSFPLESIRVLRQQRERAAQQRYSRAMAAADTAERTLQAAGSDLTGGYRTLEQELKQGTGSARILHLRTWCTVLESRVKECEAALLQARQAAAEALNFLNAARRDRETLDRFHDKSWNAWKHFCQQAEQKMLDELAIQRQHSPSLEHGHLN
ncbi:MAG TPA: flagellar FliJ family protein [Verrucomicrobiae bacterium]